jgi:predicted nucleic acid-binding protein
MKKLKLYLDTTVWNYPFETHSPERTADTVEFFRLVRMGLYEVFYSDMVIFEIEATRTPRRDLMMKLFREIAPQELKQREEIEILAEEYLERNVLPKKSRIDALHVAYSTVYQMDALVSWNFQHLANMNRRNRVIALNIEKGYNFPVELVTPLEVLGDDKD